MKRPELPILPVSLLILFMFLSVPVYEARGEVYKYLDDEGQIHFTDDLTTIPEKYWDEVQTLKVSRKEPAERTPASAPELPGPPSTAVDIDEFGHVYLQVEARYRSRSETFRFMLDTGSSMSSLTAHAADMLGVIYAEGETSTVVADGRVVSNGWVTLDKMQVGPFVLENKPVLIHGSDPRQELPYEGLLGQDLLSKVEYRLDRENKQIQWLKTDF
ncbi:MAG: aspartyl protease family protein [Deltaproteobacteria bacterium]|nr:aspartyl protease family protein [Deltaproteobacteria bacterium]